MRYEFLEAIVRAAISKYGKGVETDDLVDAVNLLVERNLLAIQQPAARFDCQRFRSERLYTEEVHTC